jgi:hypothetical protein
MKIYLMYILILVRVKIAAQEATPTRHFEIEVSLASKIYDKTHYVEAAKSDGEKVGMEVIGET